MKPERASVSALFDDSELVELARTGPLPYGVTVLDHLTMLHEQTWKTFMDGLEKIAWPWPPSGRMPP